MSLFGNNATGGSGGPATSLFGTAPKAPAPAIGSGLFGNQPAASSGNLLGAPAPTTG